MPQPIAGLDERLLPLISPRVGIIRSVTRVGRSVTEPTPPVLCQAILSNYDFHVGDPMDRTASGKGETEADAVLGAIGEALERYCASVFDQRAFRKTAARDLGPEAVRPEDFVLYSPEQYARKDWPYRRPDPEVPISWVAGHELPDGNQVLLPASLVYLNAITEQREDFFAPPTSNGLAAGQSLAAAILGGFYELIERDAFLISWMNRLPCPRVDYRSLPGLPQTVREHHTRFGVETLVFNLTVDIPVYVMAAVAIDQSGRGPAVVVGLGCHLNPVTALRKALMEVCQVRPGEVMRHARKSARERLRSYEDIHDIVDHSGFASLPENQREFNFLLGNGRTQCIEKLPNHSQGSDAADRDQVVGLLRAAGCRPVYVDLTTPDVVEFGIHAVRAVATGLQPMHFGHGQERLGGRRLYEVPKMLGFETRTRTAQDMNPCPHPLA